MAARLGNVLYWAFWLIAVGSCYLMYNILDHPNPELHQSPYTADIASFVVLVIIWAFGWTCRYILTGRRDWL